MHRITEIQDNYFSSQFTKINLTQLEGIQTSLLLKCVIRFAWRELSHFPYEGSFESRKTKLFLFQKKNKT